MSKLLNLQKTVPEVGFKPISAINLQATDMTPIMNSLGKLSQVFTETAKTRTKMDSLQYMNNATKEFLDRSRQDKDYSIENYEGFKEALKEEVGEMFGGVYQDTTDWVNKSLDKTLDDSHKVYGMEMSTNFFNDTTQDIRTKINDGVDLSIIKELTLSAVNNYDAMHEVGFLDTKQLEAMTVKSHWDALEYGYQQTLDGALEGVTTREEAEAIVKKYSKINSTQIKDLGGRGDEDISKLAGFYGNYARSLPKGKNSKYQLRFTGNTRYDFAENAGMISELRNSDDPDDHKLADQMEKKLNDRLKQEQTDGDSVGLLIADGKIPADLEEGAMYNSSIKDWLSGMGANFDEDLTYDENFAEYMEEDIDADKGIRRKDTIMLFPKSSSNYQHLMARLEGLSTKEKVAFAHEYANGKINLAGKNINNKAIAGQFQDPYMKKILFNSVASAGGFNVGDFTIFDPSNQTDTTEIEKIMSLTNGLSEGDIKAGLAEQGYETKTFLRDTYDSGLGTRINEIRSLGGEHAKVINGMKQTFDKMLEKAGATGNLDKATDTINKILDENFPSSEFDGRTIIFPKNRGGIKADSRAIKNLYSKEISEGKYYYKTSQGNIPLTNIEQFTMRNDGTSQFDHWTLRQDPSAFIYTVDENGREIPMTSDIIADQTNVNEAKVNSPYAEGARKLLQQMQNQKKQKYYFNYGGN